jgi:protein-tyrosine phosphatase
MNRIRSFARVVHLYILLTLDNLHRHVYGTPIIKRSQITTNLFLGSQYNLIGLKKLKSIGITAIVNMRMHSVYSESVFEGIKYLHLPTIDNTPPTLDDLKRGADFMDDEIKRGGIVYVHCRQGLGRGPTMAIAYLIKTGITHEDAFRLVKLIRPFISPKPEQILRLIELEAYYNSQE